MKKIFYFLITCFFLLLNAALISCSKKTDNTICAGFYKIEESVAEKMQTALENIAKNNDFELSFKTLASEDELSKAIKAKKIQLVFTTAGNGQRICNSYAKTNAGMEEDVSETLSTSLRQSIIKNKALITAVPVLCDNMEIDINTRDFKNSNTKAINNWNDIENFLASEKSLYKSPMVFAGSDSVAFFDMLGALCEAIDGPAYYNQALEILNSNDNADDIASKLMSSSSSPMVNTTITLKKFFRSNLILKESFNLTTKDMEAFAKANEINFMVMSLSQHRTFANSIIRNYSSAYFPSKNEASIRVFTANLIYAIPAVKNNSASAFIKLLFKDENQESLCRATGLAPVSKSCRTPDIQSDDVRYWIAATNTPFAGLGHDTTKSEEELKNIENSIKTILLYE